MKNIALKIEYDGTKYAGWQIQKNGLAVQAVMEEAMEAVLRHKIKLVASGRTDSSVHALGQVANFFTDSPMGGRRMLLAINSQLPDDIRVSNVAHVPDDFHSRYSAIGKTYVYIIECRNYKSPFLNGRAYSIKDGLDIEKMRQAGKLFLGEHDFAAFKSQGSSVKTSVRTIYSLDIKEEDGVFSIEIRGSGFLYNMVRIIAGTLIEIGQGNFLDIEGALEHGDRGLVGPTAPAHGLFLKEVKYSVDIWGKDDYNIKECVNNGPHAPDELTLYEKYLRRKNNEVLHF